MLQYLINTTMIWLLSLLVFDLFLRRESYHSYNRLYLLLTFMLGIFLPILQWQSTDIIYNTVTSGTVAAQPIARAIVAKQAVIQATTIETANTTNWVQWIWVLYYAGVVVTTILLIKDIIILSRYFKTGTKSKDGVWHIVETGKQHSPFSAFRCIFISSKNDYNPAELRMILTHEEQHGHSLHFIDMLIMEAGKIIFWFHPLVYLFQKRLLILHEYQADAAVENEPNEYGQFLIQQSVLQSAPPLSHSLNRSPIKKRLIMLTRTSSLAAGFKRLVVIPLCIICLFLFTENAISKSTGKEGNTLYYNGNVFELRVDKILPSYVTNTAQYKLWMATTGVPDTIIAPNPRTGINEPIVPFRDTVLAKMNGREIIRFNTLPEAEQDRFFSTTGTEIKKHLLETLKPLIGKLQDGEYQLFNYAILDEGGKIVYTRQPWRWSKSNPDYNEALMNSLEKDAFKIIESTTKNFTPVKHAGKTEIMRIPGQTLIINNHKAKILDDSGGC